MNDKIKHEIRICLATIGLSLILLACVAMLYNARFLCVETVFQTSAANVIIHVGLCFLKRFESSYFIVEILVEMGYILLVLICAGFIFGWYSSTPIGILILMGITVYIIGSLIDIFRIKNDIRLINHQLKIRNQKEKNSQTY